MDSKQSTRFVLLAILLGIAVTGGTIVPALATSTPIPVSSCGVLNEPGKYVLTTDLPTDDSPCVSIQIVADNIDFNLNGHEMIGNPFDFIPIGLADGISNVFIHNGTVIGRAEGIYVGNDSNITISDISFPGNAGPFFFGAIDIQGGSNLRITDNTFGGGNGGGSSIEALGVSNSVFSGNVFTGLGFVGLENAFLLKQSSGNMISGNTINIGSAFGSGGDGVVLEAGSSGNMVRGNTIKVLSAGFFPPVFGIYIEPGATNNSIQSNTVTGGVYDGNGPPCVNSWKNNTFSFASGAVACIQ